MNERLARYTKSVLAIIAMTGCAAGAAPTRRARVPGWLKLRVGQSAYFYPGDGARAVTCPSFDAVVRFINAPKSLTSPKCPLLPRAGQLVTVLGWKMYRVARNWLVPIVHVRFPGGVSTAWVMYAGLTPVVPHGITVVITGNDCSAEAARLHMDISTLAGTLRVCTGVVVKQLATSSENLLVVRFVHTEAVIRIIPDSALYPNITAQNGMPKYSVGLLVWDSGLP